MSARTVAVLEVALRIFVLSIICSLAAACGDASLTSNEASGGFSGAPTDSDSNGNNGSPGAGLDDSGSEFVPEVEVIDVRTVASTDDFVFVPNSAETGSTVARISGRDLSVLPIPVGLQPTDVVAFETEGGPVAVVLVEGTHTVAVIRSGDKASELVSLLPIPGEVNALTASPDGKHVLAYIDPNRPFPAGASVASLQAAALIRVGEARGADEVFELSVTRLIRDVEFVGGGDELYLVGREGINHLTLSEVTRDAFVPPLDLRLSDDVFPPTDLEIEVAQDNTFLVVRSSAYEGVSIHAIEDGALSEPAFVKLPDIPTDIDLITGDTPRVLTTVRDAGAFAIIDVVEALAATDEAPYVAEVVTVGEATAGLAQLLPDESAALLYSTVVALPTLSVFDLVDHSVRAYPLRGKIRSVSVAPSGESAVVVHEAADAPLNDFQSTNALTIFDIATGYRRPIALDGEPIDIAMVETEDNNAYVFVLLESDAARQGVVRVDLQTFRNDFVPLARAPRQMGVVAGRVFVSQEATDGRITFLDPTTLQQRTVSGYELNAGID